MYFNRLLKITSLTLIFVFLSACSGQGQHTTSSENSFRLASTSEEVTNCESKIRNQMENKSVLMDQVADFKTEVTLANETLKLSDEKEFSISQSKGEIIELAVSHSLKSNEKTSFDYTLSKPDQDADGILSLSLEASRMDESKLTTLSEEFLVSKNCELKMTEASLEVLSRTKPRHYKYNTKTIYIGGESEEDEDTFTVSPHQEPLANFWLDSDLAKWPRHSSQYVPGVGVLDFSITELPVKTMTEFGLNLNLKSYTGTMALSNQKIQITFGHDEKENVKLTTTNLTESDEQKSWLLPYGIWKTLALSTSGDLNETVSYSLPKGYLLSHNSFTLQSKKVPDYDHISAYFRFVSFDPNQKYSYVIAENEEASVKAEATAQDLESNDTIQVNLPQIQEIAQGILIQAPDDRLKQIQLLLDYLKANYTYDYEMLKNNVIRPLTTEQVLKRKKGVCQHYSVLYTAIARAMKIPTRIVMGYLLNNSAGAHAWVESETSPGIWRVIEPQSPDSLKKIYTRFYLPITRARFLEDKNENSIDLGFQLLSMKLAIKPNE